MDAIGGQEIKMPVVHAADVWKASGRYEEYDESLTRFHDRHGRDMVLATTHEEIVADLASREIRSYRQLPAMVYHFQTKWRDEARPTSGLLRVREFTMKDSYSLDAAQEGLEAQYRAHYQAYFDIFRRCGLPVRAVRSDVGMMGGSAAHEFMYLNEVGGEHPGPVRRLRVRGQHRGRPLRQGGGGGRGAGAPGEGGHPGGGDDRRAGRLPRRPREAHGEGGLSRGPLQGRRGRR